MRITACLLLLPAFAAAQSFLSSSSRVRYGPDLPATCKASGDVFVLTHGDVGTHVCSAPNIWTKASLPGDFATTVTGNQVSIAAGTASFGTHVCPNGVGAGAVTFTGGSGDALIYIDRQCQLTTLTTPVITATYTGTMNVQAADMIAFPTGSKPIAHVTVTSGTPTLKADLRTDFSTVPVLAGANIAVTETAGTLTIETNPATVPGLGTTNRWTGHNDYGAAGSLTMPTGKGPPPATNCNAAKVGNKYVDTAIGGREYYCQRTGEVAYAWTPSGASAPLPPQPITTNTIPKVDWFPVGGAEREKVAEMGAGWWSPVSGATGGVGIGVDSLQRAFLNFVNDADRFVVFGYMLPSSWDEGVVGVRIPWLTGTVGTPAPGHIFGLRLATACVGDDENFTSTPVYNGEQTPNNLTVTAAGRLMFAAVPSLTMTGCKPGELLMIQFRRDVKDTLTTNAHVYGLEISLNLKPPSAQP